jgi:hypothetical protein
MAAPAAAARTEAITGTNAPAAALPDGVAPVGVAETRTASFMPAAQWPGTLQM